MEEIKKQENAQNPNQGGRKRHRRHRKNKGNSEQKEQGVQNNQKQNVNGGSRPNNQKGQKNQGTQNNQKQNASGDSRPNNQKGQKNQGAQNNQKQNTSGDSRPNNQKGQKNQGAQNNQKQNANGGSRPNNQKGQKEQGVQNNQKQNASGDNHQENKEDTYVYVLDGTLYVNLTNKCSNGCDFCVRNERDSYYGYYLWLKNGDPTVEKVIAQANALGELSKYKEAVFCGFGEPTYKVTEMVALCDYFHSKGLKTRLNTNGQGNLINKRDIVPELKDKIDLVNVSLNASCAEKYQPICRSQFGENGFTALVEFAKTCKRNNLPCRFSIVNCIGEEEVNACKRLAQSVNVPLYIRDYITDS